MKVDFARGHINTRNAHVFVNLQFRLNVQCLWTWSENRYCSKLIALFNDKRSHLNLLDISFRLEVIYWFQTSADDVILFCKLLGYYFEIKRYLLWGMLQVRRTLQLCYTNYEIYREFIWCLDRHANSNQALDSIYLWKHSSTFYTFCISCQQNDVIHWSYKIVDNSKTKQGIKIFWYKFPSFNSAIHGHIYSFIHTGYSKTSSHVYKMIKNWRNNRTKFLIICFFDINLPLIRSFKKSIWKYQKFKLLNFQTLFNWRKKSASCLSSLQN